MFIIRHGVLRYGLGLGFALFAWVVAGEYAGPLEHLRTPAAWLRVALLLVLCVAEWVVGAGWLIGAGLWYLREHPVHPRPPDASPAPRHRSGRDR